MNYNKLLRDYIEKCPFDEPIFIEDIKKYITNILDSSANFNQVLKTIYVYINRLVKEKCLEQFSKGIYYKPLKGMFGNKKLNMNKVITKKYIVDENGQKGYYTGAFLFNKLGLTTQIPKNILIVTNECPNKNDYNNKSLGVTIRKPKIEINGDNYKYLQLFDMLNNKDNISIEVENEKEIIYKYIKENELDFAEIFKFAKLTKNKKAIERLYELS